MAFLTLSDNQIDRVTSEKDFFKFNDIFAKVFKVTKNTMISYKIAVFLA